LGPCRYIKLLVAGKRSNGSEVLVLGCGTSLEDEKLGRWEDEKLWLVIMGRWREIE
jgi:hypothetical protein